MKLAVIIPWFGRDLKGGAEQHAWQIASRLAARGHTLDVLTTCCRSHQEDWATNHFPPGVVFEPEGFSVRRFPVVPRDQTAFDRVCHCLLTLDLASLTIGVPPISEEDSRVFTSELIKSPALLKFLAEQKEGYDSFIFLPYLYGPILDGIRLVGARGVLQPCLHDEAYAYLPEVAEAFYQARSILFISEGEQELSYRLFGAPLASKSIITGAGVENNATFATEPPTKQSDRGKYVLYLGRKDEGKNVPLLLGAFSRFRTVRPNSNLKLLLAGHGSVELNGANGSVIDLGLVNEEDKASLLTNCAVLVQPSRNESFSRVMMEAWLNGRPVAVHARCPATSIAVRQAAGGWLAESETDWARLFVEIDRTPEAELARIGASGRSYARDMADWDSVISRYEKALSSNLATATGQTRFFNHKSIAINQALPNLAYGDAISNHALWIRDRLRALGYTSKIFARFIDPRVADECLAFSADQLQASDAIIYHHSIGTEITPHILRFEGPKCLVYHNITPAEFFTRYRPQFGHILRQGREDLPNLARHFEISVGDSVFNAAELQKAGFQDPGVLPITIDPGKWNLAPNPLTMEKLQDGWTNIIFVGRIAPNKKQDDLVEAFAHYRLLDANSRLILAGAVEEEDPYVTHLLERIGALHLGEAVLLPGSVPNSELAAYYRTATLFWSMSEHEGFCVPLIEAMWFDVPVLAFRSSAVPETLGEAAFMFGNKNSFTESAALAYLIAHDSALREKIIKAQRECRLKFLPDEVMPQFQQIVNKLLVGTAAR
ncbi:MAG: group 1 glycosyl transferase [Verrucomicrobia bacterium]|nr:MAG: group 1 glycosyl transferase [Verrucomicrobiota bacterium]